jgi:twitching motility protein PilT
MENTTASENFIGGYPRLNTLPEIDPRASRLLPVDVKAIVISCVGDIARVITPTAPSPAEYRALERLAGCLIALEVATEEIWQQLVASSTRASGVADIGAVLEAAIAIGASDVHLGVGTPPMLRVRGHLRDIDSIISEGSLPGFRANFGMLSSEDCQAAAKYVAGDAYVNFTGDLDLGFSHGGQRWRASVWRQRGSVALTLRLIAGEIPRLEELGLPASVVEFASLTHGLVLLCGPTGAGKSTTMAGIVDRINRSRADHVITIEDPIEYVHPNHRSIVRQREIGADTDSFAIALRAALRQDPDVILVGELRDTETMKTALQAAETGHLVLATVHASSASGALTRIINAFPSDQQDQVRNQLSACLQGIVAQLLIPAMDNGRRALACEVLVGTAAVRAMLRENRVHEMGTVVDTGGQYGMVSMDRSLAQLVAADRITREVAETHANDVKGFTEHLNRLADSRVQTAANLDPLAGLQMPGEFRGR